MTLKLSESRRGLDWVPGEGQRMAEENDWYLPASECSARQSWRPKLKNWRSNGGALTVEPHTVTTDLLKELFEVATDREAPKQQRTLVLHDCDLPRVQLPGQRTIFASLHFAGATFLELADFGGATFDKEVVFDGATFNEDGGFDKATFNGHASFLTASFKNYGRFKNAVFFRGANFGGSTFMSHADFKAARFIESASFSETSFSRDATFTQSQFEAEAIFERAQFEIGNRFTGARIDQGQLSGGKIVQVPDTIEEVLEVSPSTSSPNSERGRQVGDPDPVGVGTQAGELDAAAAKSSTQIPPQLTAAVSSVGPTDLPIEKQFPSLALKAALAESDIAVAVAAVEPMLSRLEYLRQADIDNDIWDDGQHQDLRDTLHSYRHQTNPSSGRPVQASTVKGLITTLLEYSLDDPDLPDEATAVVLTPAVAALSNADEIDGVHESVSLIGEALQEALHLVSGTGPGVVAYVLDWAGNRLDDTIVVGGVAGAFATIGTVIGGVYGIRTGAELTAASINGGVIGAIIGAVLGVLSLFRSRQQDEV